MPPTLNVSDLPRIRQIVGVLARQGFGRRLARTGLGRFLPENGTEATIAEPWPVRVRKTLIELGPTFVKLGQVLSVRPDLVPLALSKELQALLDRVDPVEFPAIRKVLEDELGAPVADLFATFDEAPLASASIAQVHRATLSDGTEVAVKIQRPDIEPVIRSDVRILYALARVLEGEIEMTGVYTLSDIVAEFEGALYQELDFLREARNCERFKASIAPSHPQVFVPRTFPRLSTRRVLVMELCHGQPASVLTAADPRASAFARSLLDCTLKQTFENGLFHGDPHPGNVFILDDGRLAYLDFGLLGTLTADMQQSLTAIFTALVFRDAEGLALAVYRAGGTDGRVDLRTFKSEVDRLLDKYNGASISTFADRSNLLEILEVASRHRIILPREFAILGRTAALTYGLVQKLIPDVDVMEEVKPLAQKLLTKQLDPSRVASDTARLLLHAQSSLTHLPLQVNQLLGDLEAGRLQLVTRNPDSEASREQIHREGYRITLSICAAAMLVAGAIMFSAPGDGDGVPGIVAVLGMGTMIGSGFIWASLVAHTHLAERFTPRQLLRTVVRFAISRKG